MISLIGIVLVLGFVAWVGISSVTGRFGVDLVPYVAMTVIVLLLAFLAFVFISVATGGNSLVTVGS